jgi:hypothetical protein
MFVYTQDDIYPFWISAEVCTLQALWTSRPDSLKNDLKKTLTVFCHQLFGYISLTENVLVGSYQQIGNEI